MIVTDFSEHLAVSTRTAQHCVPGGGGLPGGLGGGLGGVTSSLLNGGLDATGALGGLGGASSLLGGLYNP
ncbi:MAG: hypothetical protein KDA87_25160, partial [Planctomycetales bacterium]|nr:hypothetical protein [Planctomycetales bacterium]